MHQNTALNFMRVANHLSDKSTTVVDFSAKALYLLAAPSTPEPVREQVLQDAENGIIRTNAEAAVTGASLIGCIYI